jgi:hypothetical protein
MSFLNNRLEIFVDWWRKETEDLLFQIPVAGVVGNSAAAPSVNIATMLNQGVDIQLIARGGITRDLRYEVTLNNSFLTNEITFMAPGIDFFDGGAYRGIRPIRNAVGQPLSSFFGYRVLGYFNSEEEVQNAPEQPGAGLGRFRYDDVNGDGVITPDDRTFIGDPVPDYTGGYTFGLFYKNFGLNMYWYASVGGEIFNQSKWFTDFFGTFEGSGKGVRAKDSWTPELGNDAKAPIWESVSNISTSGAENSWYVEDGSFLRLQQLALSYDFSTGLIERWGLSRLRLSVAANNLVTFTKYSGLDPMVGGGADTNFGIDVGNYPVTRGYTFVLGVTF